jgi:ribonuclease E
MTQKIMLINEADDECRIAVVEDGVLQEMLIEHRTKEQIKNNIYKGTVVQVQPSLQAAFVDFGLKKHGFLPSGEINHTLFSKKNVGGGSPIQQKIKKGQSVLVQVTREAIDQKGAALTTYISLPGRFMVLMPNSNKGGVSKRIEASEERERLKSFLSGIETEKHAIIIRTAGVGRDLNDLKKDYTTIKRTWEEIYERYKNMAKPGLIQEESDVIARTLRDYYTEDIQEIWVDNPETFQKVHQFLKEVSPRKQKDLKLFVGDRSLFSTYKIERQVEQLTSREVKLNSGGSIVIEQTEALVSIDVNSGRSNQEGDIDATALRTNLEAAREIARHLRLRNMGGLIVVDFIDMDREESRRKVELELQQAMERDKAHRKYNPISQFGILEMSRQRLSIGISSTVESVCPTCNGKGRILSLLASTNYIIRSIREIAANGHLQRIEGKLPLSLANHLLNERRQSIADLELEFGINILLRGDPGVPIFNESLLKPVYDKDKSPKTSVDEPVVVAPVAAEPEAKPDTTQAETSRKKHRRRDKDTAGKRPGGVEDPPATEQVAASSKGEPAADPSDPLPRQQPPVEATSPVEDMNKTHEVSPVRRESIVPGPASMIHQSCLFRNVRELDADELAAITVSFENRLKGKINNKPPVPINAQYLWKTFRATETEKDEAAEPQITSSVTADAVSDRDPAPGSPTDQSEALASVSEGHRSPVVEKQDEGDESAAAELETGEGKASDLPATEGEAKTEAAARKPGRSRRGRKHNPSIQKTDTDEGEPVAAGKGTGLKSIEKADAAIEIAGSNAESKTVAPVTGVKEFEASTEEPSAAGSTEPTPVSEKSKKTSTARKKTTSGRSAPARKRKSPTPSAKDGENKDKDTPKAGSQKKTTRVKKPLATEEADPDQEKVPARRKSPRTRKKPAPKNEE